MTSSLATRFQPRRVLRRLAESIACRLPSRIPDSASLVLAYHNVVADDDAGKGDASLHLPVSEFRRQLQVARSEATIVDLPTLLDKIGEPGRRIAVTFDDAYLGCMTHGLENCALEEVIPTVFVAPGLFGTLPAWDVAAASGRWSHADRERFLVELEGRSLLANREIDTQLPETYRIATAAEVERAVARFGCHLGNHTYHHVNLSRLDGPIMCDELRECHASVAAMGARAVDVVAFPYGLAPAPALRDELALWCRAAFLVEGGWLAGPTFDVMSLPRLNVPAGLSLNGFRTRLRGWR